MLIVSSREFRDNQKSYFDKIDEGVKVLIQRGRDKTYQLKRVSAKKKVAEKDDSLMTQEEFFAKIDRGLQQYREGKYKSFNSSEEMFAWLDRL